MTDTPRPQSHADAAPGRPRQSEEDPNAPYARRISPEDATDDQLSKKHKTAEDRQEALIDESVEETFPASDPVSPKHIT